ncbi:hypothetical protein J2S82_001408 [Aeromonas caviae]|uniref:hypothetical protein n=1 Tax=Aeromonas caviae TaxID=648 RepID=UPI00209FC6CF|nr:hypothetical protein [Aeromonas caviae]MCP1599451.1 hypothetical protein [Aeromonas caviae]
MFADLLKILNLIKASVQYLSNLRKSSDRKQALLEMLKTYFYLYDTYVDGIKLLESIDNDPVNYIKSLKDDSLKEHLKIWDQVLRRQGIRLYNTQQYITSQSYLAVINPSAVENISKIIGYKMDRLVTLHGLGASLFFRNIFPIEDTPETLANLVLQALTKQKNGLIEKESVSNELDNFKKSLDEFRIMIDVVIDKEEILELSDKARKETNLSANF